MSSDVLYVKLVTAFAAASATGSAAVVRVTDDGPSANVRFEAIQGIFQHLRNFEGWSHGDST